MPETNIEEKEMNLCSELNKQKDILMYLNDTTNKILNILRGALNEDSECMPQENCMLDTVKNNKTFLKRLEKNINEIEKRVIG